LLEADQRRRRLDGRLGRLLRSLQCVRRVQDVMKLTPREQDRLTIFSMAELARRRRARGVRLNHPEAIALICDELLEEARAGRPYAEVVELGGRLLERPDVMDGVAEMIPLIQLEALFPDGSKLLTIHRPIK
jgi:urease gamma subunit